ncbi:AAA family ATPase [Candidatus Cyanaurora vandensis]|uniref:ATP-binding protein n=1 Tax=Candidatus Cyanaurora vandensis TaxID=2714958 RepID=UPI00257DC3EE|nr:AAA family ATPase [Candidatus Cyanaurora vandensis]
MNHEESLILLDTLLYPNKLNDIQTLVFVECWEGHSYAQIAETHAYDSEYIKGVGSKLWQRISEALGEPVTKNSFRSVLTRRPLPAAPARARRLLPQPLTPLVGRTQEVDHALALLWSAHVRLVTFTGPGGTGKTRLALEVATLIQQDFSDGTVFVALAPLRDPALVVLAIAQALGLKEVGRQPLAETLQDYIYPKQLLLVLDNFEHLLPAVDLVAQLLTNAPHLKIIVTSRTVLRLYGEYEFPVPPLGLPDPDQPDLLAPAVQLFLERARAVHPGLELPPNQAKAVAQCCVQLDGLPLALELAAAQSKVLTPQAILNRLNQRLSLGERMGRTGPTHQRTLRETMDWSYELLTPHEQALFTQLGVFWGGASLAAIAQVCQEPDVETGLQALLDKSLIRQRADHQGEPRYFMLQILQEYAQARCPEPDELKRRHAHYFAQLARRAQTELAGSNQRFWLAYLAEESANLRAVLTWCLAHDPDLGLQIAGDCWLFWEVRSLLSEGQYWLTQLLARTVSAPSQGRAQVLNITGRLAIFQGDFRQAQVWFQQGLALCRELDYRRGKAFALANLGALAWYQGDYPRGQQLGEEGLALAIAIQDRWLEGAARNTLGLVALAQGDIASAQRQNETSLNIYQELQDRWSMAILLWSLGGVATALGDYPRARDCYQRGLLLHRELQNEWGLAHKLAGLGQVALFEGDPVRAARLLGAAETLGERLGTPPAQIAAQAFLMAVQHVQAALGDSFQTLWEEGCALNATQAVDYALINRERVNLAWATPLALKSSI